MFQSAPNYVVNVFVTRKRIERGGGHGLKTPTNFDFYDSEKAITWIRYKI